MADSPEPARPAQPAVPIDAADDARGIVDDLDALVVLQVQRAVGDDALAGLQAIRECDACAAR